MFVRDVSRAAEARAASAAVGLPVRVLPLAGAAAAVAAADVVISTLPPRAADAAGRGTAQRNCGERQEAARIGPGVLLDVAYDPWPSRIACGLAGRRAAPWFPGLEMLIYQAVEQVRHFTGRWARPCRPES